MSKTVITRQGGVGAFERLGKWAGAMGLVLMLMGCGAAGGASKDAADAGLLEISGVSEASVNTDSVTSGFQKEISTVVELTLAPGVTVPDEAALADYLVRVAWSTKTTEANWTVRVQVLSDPQISMFEALDAAGWETASGLQNSPERASVRADEVKDRLGDWPGEVPELPDGLIVGPTADPGS
jgi:hypothetical protein